MRKGTAAAGDEHTIDPRVPPPSRFYFLEYRLWGEMRRLVGQLLLLPDRTVRYKLTIERLIQHDRAGTFWGRVEPAPYDAPPRVLYRKLRKAMMVDATLLGYKAGDPRLMHSRLPRGWE